MQIIQRAARNAEDASRSGAVAIHDGTSALFATAEDGTGSAPPGAVARVLAREAAALLHERVAPASWPASLAARIGERLAAKQEGDPAWLLFAAVVVSNDEIQVCTAGDIRIHLVRGGEVVRATRDHVLANESPAWVKATYGDLSVADHGSMVTRSLGSGSRPPEADRWVSEAPFLVLVCSSADHCYRPPATYAPALLDALLRGDEAAGQGLLARIHV